MKHINIIASATLSLLIVFGFLLAANSLYAWTNPTQTAPNGNTPAPITVGTSTVSKQAIQGSLGVDSLAVYGNGSVQGALGVGTANPIRSLTVNNGEISLIRYGDGNAYFNVSDINGSGSGNLTIRGLNSNGTAGANLGSLNFDANQVCLNGSCTNSLTGGLVGMNHIEVGSFATGVDPSGGNFSNPSSGYYYFPTPFPSTPQVHAWPAYWFYDQSCGDPHIYMVISVWNVSRWGFSWYAPGAPSGGCLYKYGVQSINWIADN